MPATFDYIPNKIEIIISDQSTPRPYQMVNWSNFLDIAVSENTTAETLRPVIASMELCHLKRDLELLDKAIKVVKDHPPHVEYVGWGDEDRFTQKYTVEQLLSAKKHILECSPANIIAETNITKKDKQGVENDWAAAIQNSMNLTDLLAVWTKIKTSPLFTQRRHPAFDKFRNLCLLRWEHDKYTVTAQHIINAAQQRALDIVSVTNSIDEQTRNVLNRIFNPEYLQKGISPERSDELNALIQRRLSITQP